jgi:hypothetical protein
MVIHQIGRNKGIFMKLYMVHVGFYNETWGSGIFENHTNFFVVAENPKDARLKVKEKEDVKKFRMHIDGIVEINQIDGYKIELSKTVSDDTSLSYTTHRELATPTSNSN